MCGDSIKLLSVTHPALFFLHGYPFHVFYHHLLYAPDKSAGGVVKKIGGGLHAESFLHTSEDFEGTLPGGMCRRSIASVTRL